MRYLTGEEEKEAVRWMRKAAEVAGKAMCLRAKCGTVIVAGSAAIGEGYNAPALDKEENRRCGKDMSRGKPKYDRTCCVHAEWRAIMDALRRHPGQIAGSKLYFARAGEDGAPKRSGQPFCTVCSRLALDAGIGHFLLWHEQGVGEYSAQEYDELSGNYIHQAS